MVRLSVEIIFTFLTNRSIKKTLNAAIIYLEKVQIFKFPKHIIDASNKLRCG